MWTILKLLGGIQPNYWGEYFHTIFVTLDCDIAGQSESSNLSEPIPPSVGQPSAMAIVEREFLNNSPGSLVKVFQYNTGPQSAPCELAGCNDVSPTGAQSSNPCKRKRSASRQQHNDDLMEIKQ